MPSMQYVKELFLYLGSVVLIVVGARLVLWLWRGFFRRLADRTKTSLDANLLKATERPVYMLALSFGIYEATRRLFAVEGLREHILRFQARFDDVFFIINVLLVTWGIWAAVSTALKWYKEEIAVRTDTDLDDAVVNTLSSVSKLVLYFIATTIILSHFGITITSLLATAGVASLAVAFAAQETIGNMLAGFTIMIDRPFRVGDRIELADGTIGDVFEVGLRSTKVLSFDNTLIVMPNRDIAQAKVVNQSYPDSKVKVRINIGVAYGSDMNRVKQVIREVCQAHPKVMDDPEVGVYFTSFGDSALDLLAICWIADYRDRFEVIDNLNMEINRRFEEENIEIPFPQRTVHLLKEV